MIKKLLASDLFSFFGRLAIYSVCALYTGGYFSGYFLYIFLDLIVMDLALKYIYGMTKIGAGEDTMF